jgi:hypothetical protein
VEKQLGRPRSKWKDDICSLFCDIDSTSGYGASNVTMIDEYSI